MAYESTPTAARIEIREQGTDWRGFKRWIVILWEGGTAWQHEYVSEDGPYFFSFARRLKWAQQRLLKKYELVKKLSGPVFVRHDCKREG